MGGWRSFETPSCDKPASSRPATTRHHPASTACAKVHGPPRTFPMPCGTPTPMHRQHAHTLQMFGGVVFGMVRGRTWYFLISRSPLHVSLPLPRPLYSGVLCEENGVRRNSGAARMRAVEAVEGAEMRPSPARYRGAGSLFSAATHDTLFVHGNVCNCDVTVAKGGAVRGCNRIPAALAACHAHGSWNCTATCWTMWASVV